MRHRIVDSLFEFTKQYQDHDIYWIDQDRGIFRDKIEHKSTKLDLIVQDCGTHTSIIGGLLTLSTVPRKTFQCIIEIYFGRSDNDNVISFALNKTETRIVMR